MTNAKKVISKKVAVRKGQSVKGQTKKLKKFANSLMNMNPAVLRRRFDPKGDGLVKKMILNSNVSSAPVVSKETIYNEIHENVCQRPPASFTVRCFDNYPISKIF